MNPISSTTLQHNDTFRTLKLDSQQYGCISVKTSKNHGLLKNEFFFAKYLCHHSDSTPSFFAKVDLGPLGNTPCLKTKIFKTIFQECTLPDTDLDGFNKKAISFSLIKALKFLEQKEVILPNLTDKDISIEAPGLLEIHGLDQARFNEACYQTPVTVFNFDFASPELLLNRPLSSKTPIWNAALLIGELFTKKALIPSSTSRFESMKNHIRLLARPYPKELTKHLNGREKSELDETFNLIGNKTASLKVEDETLRDLLSQMLQYNPEERPSFEDLLTHPFFAGFSIDLQAPEKKPDLSKMIENPREVAAGKFTRVIEGSLNGEKVVIKIPQANNQNFFPSFSNEDKFLRLLSKSPHVVRRIGLSEDGSILTLESLPKNLHTHIQESKGLGIEETKSFTSQLIEALSYLRTLDIVHMDLKPGNILTDGAVVKICDFEGASFVNKFYMPSMIRNTLRYISPEILLRESPSLSTDVWALGIIVAEMLLGECIFQASSEEELKHSHCMRLENIPAHMLEKLKIKVQKFEKKASLKELFSSNKRKATPGKEIFFELITKALTYDPQERPEAFQLKSLLPQKSID